MDEIEYIKKLISYRLSSFEILNLIGRGGFGYIFLVKKNWKYYGLKFQWLKRVYEIDYLENEFSILNNFKKQIGFPKVYYYKNFFNFSIMIMEILGKNLNSIFKNYNNKISYNTICYIGYKIIKILKIMHSKNIIHRDIKPSNILIGSLFNINEVFLIDYGLSILYTKNTNFQNNEEDVIIGTPKFCSINGHKEIEQKPKDDLESFGYTLIYLLFGKLPWENYLNYEKIKYEKIKLNPENFKNNYPIMEKYFNSIYFNTKKEIDYEYLINLFKNELMSFNFDLYEIENNHKQFEWNKHYKELKKSTNFKIVKKNSLKNYNKKKTIENKKYFKSKTKINYKENMRMKSYFSKTTEKKIRSFSEEESFDLKSNCKNYDLIKYQKNKNVNIEDNDDNLNELTSKIKKVYVFKLNKNFNRFN